MNKKGGHVHSYLITSISMEIINRPDINVFDLVNRAWDAFGTVLTHGKPVFVQNNMLRHERNMDKQLKRVFRDSSKLLLPVGFEGYITPIIIESSLRQLKIERTKPATNP